MHIKLLIYYSILYKLYQNKDGHKCNHTIKPCKLCLEPEHLSSKKNRINCKKCNRFFYDQECLEKHNYVNTLENVLIVIQYTKNI